MPHRSQTRDPRRRRQQPHEVLGLSPRESDAVKVIEVAHLLLRRWRRVPLAETAAKTAGVAGEARTRIRQIIAAREAMLVRIHARWHRSSSA